MLMDGMTNMSHWRIYRLVRVSLNYYISDLHLFYKNVTDEGSNFDNRHCYRRDEEEYGKCGE